MRNARVSAVVAYLLAHVASLVADRSRSPLIVGCVSQTSAAEVDAPATVLAVGSRRTPKLREAVDDLLSAT
jgi:hypothetical protein